MNESGLSITIRYFAALREARGLSEETVKINTRTPRTLYKTLQEQHSFTLSDKDIKVVVNDQFQDWNISLHDGDRVVFIPPVAGG